MLGIEACSRARCEEPRHNIETSLQSIELVDVELQKQYPELLYVFVTQMVASAMEVDASDIQRLPRGNAKLCRARQIAMYLMNVVLARPFKDIGDYFDKDRTTVSYACGVVEELRDIPAFDDKLKELEDILSTVLQLLPEHEGCDR